MPVISKSNDQCGRYYNGYIRQCIAQCLGLVGNASAKNNSEKCYFDKKTGAGLDAHAASCPDCMTLDFKSEVAQTIRGTNAAMPGTFKKMCNKTIYYNTAIPIEYDRHVYVCLGGIYRPSSPWVPKSVDEMKCVISNLPSMYHPTGSGFGSLRIFVEKNYCKSNFAYCNLPNEKYVKFNASMLPWAPSNFTSKGSSRTCLGLMFKVKNKNEVHSMQFQEVSCVEKLNAVCEGLE
ncbi:uncharacterized protein LOC132205213 [Neocloeon triangulifer]|uniref:uncharacterized protein LOC132205213 n=1 Tax=Neocloeon triangulifer TaxID=2078957 RepID=UPI00286F1AD3|nr:uncharacterized protein LOC132205213 [Neocloeon triangulifer]